MRLVVAGGRGFDDYNYVKRVLNELRQHFKIESIISGHCRGADLLGERYADEHMIKLDCYPANWDKIGRKAGMVRNEEMAQHADAVVLFPGNNGTNHMYTMGKKYGLTIFDFRDGGACLKTKGENK